MVILKIQLGDEIRRIAEAPRKLQDVKMKVTEYFGIENSFFKYVDVDGDTVKIDSQEEYEEAFVSHSLPFKLEVFDAGSQFMTGSTILKTEMGQDIHVCTSFADSFIYTDDNILISDDPKPIIIQTSDKETETFQKTESSVQASPSLTEKSTQTTFDTSLHSILKPMLSRYCTLNEPGKFEIGVRCFHCKLYIYDLVYKCPKCPTFYICEKCENQDTHSHPLIKSRKKVRSSGTNDLSHLLSKLEYMGFKDREKNFSALIRANYNVETAISFLCN